MNSCIIPFVASNSSFLRYMSCGSPACTTFRLRYSATCRDGNSVSQTYPKSLARCIASPEKVSSVRTDSTLRTSLNWIISTDQWASALHLPSTSEVNSVTFAAFLLPAGRLRPIFSSFSRRDLPPFFDFALQNSIDVSCKRQTRIRGFNALSTGRVFYRLRFVVLKS